MKLVVSTQCKENYGAHQWDGEGECPQYWKFKGGDDYVIENVTASDVPELCEKIEQFVTVDSEGYKEYVRGKNLIGDDETPWDDWEPPYVLKDNGNGFDVTREYSNDGRGYWRETWTGLPDSERVAGTWKQVPINDVAKEQLAAFKANQEAWG